MFAFLALALPRAASFQLLPQQAAVVGPVEGLADDVAGDQEEEEEEEEEEAEEEEEEEVGDGAVGLALAVVAEPAHQRTVRNARLQKREDEVDE